MSAATSKKTHVKTLGYNSADIGSTCSATDTLCVLATDATTAGTCGSSLSTFSLTPLGRKGGTGISQANWGASDYPGSTLNTITLSGASGDSLYFGPLTHTDGVGNIQN